MGEGSRQARPAHIHCLRFLAAAIPVTTVISFLWLLQKVTPNRQLRTTEMFSLTVPVARSPKPRCQQGWFHVVGSGKCWFHVPQGRGGRGRDKQSLASLSLRMHLSHLPPSPCGIFPGCLCVVPRAAPLCVCLLVRNIRLMVSIDVVWRLVVSSTSMTSS